MPSADRAPKRLNAGKKGPKKQNAMSLDNVRTLRALWLAKKVTSTREAAEIFGVSSASVSYWLRNDHFPGDCPRRPPTAHERTYLHRRKLVAALARKSFTVKGQRVPRYGSTSELRAALGQLHGISVSRQTIQADLKACGFVSRVRPRVCSTDKQNYARRLTFCMQNKKLKGERIVFSDEKYFTASGSAHRTQWVPPGGSPLPRRSLGYAPKLMIWGAIGVGYRHLVLVKSTSPGLNGAYRYRGPGAGRVFVKRSADERFNMTAEWYKKNCLQGSLVKHVKDNDLFFMQDGAGAHKGSATRYLNNKGVKLLNWVAHSPDLNPIERLWAILQRRVQLHHPQSIEDLETAVTREFGLVTQGTIDKLVRSFDRRVAEVRALNGGW